MVGTPGEKGMPKEKVFNNLGVVLMVARESPKLQDAVRVRTSRPRICERGGVA